MGVVYKYKYYIYIFIFLYQWHISSCVYVLHEKTRQRERVYITVGVVGFSSAD
jgi:hypothetical protein